MTHFRRTLKILRNKNNMPQREIAKLMGISQSAYSRLENNKVKAGLEQIEQLAKIFGVRPAYLVDPKSDDSE